MNSMARLVFFPIGHIMKTALAMKKEKLPPTINMVQGQCNKVDLGSVLLPPLPLKPKWGLPPLMIFSIFP